MTSFCFLAASLPRLAAFRHALDSTSRGALSHISIRANGDAATVTASDGRLLAIMRLSPSDFDGDPVDIVIDGSQFALACGTLVKADYASVVRIAVNPDEHEVRLTRGTAVAVARIVDVRYPLRSDYLSRFRAQQLVPAIASYAPPLIATAARIVGKRTTAMLLWSPSPDSDVARCWSTDADADVSVPQRAMSALIRQPGFYVDNELLVGVWPIMRSMTGAPDLAAYSGAHSYSQSATAAA